MRIAIQFSECEERKALPILLRHSQGMVLRNRVYVITVEAARALRDAGVRFTAFARDADSFIVGEATTGERI